MFTHSLTLSLSDSLSLTYIHTYRQPQLSCDAVFLIYSVRSTCTHSHKHTRTGESKAPTPAISKRAVGTGYCTDANKQEMVTYVTTKIRRTVESCFQACKSVQPNCIGFNSDPKQTAHSCILFLKDRTSMTSNEALPGGENEWHRVVQPNSNVNKWGPPAQGNPQKQYGTCYVVEVAPAKANGI